MSSNPCDECGRPMDKAHRVHAGVRYCATCYARCFKRRLCEGCGMFSRLLRSDPKARCDRCEKSRPCVRCGKTDFAIGKMTAYGPVCAACRPHFTQAQPCERCGGLSRKLSRVHRQGGDQRVCSRCARSDFATCQSCRRHRLLQPAPDGRRLCAKCLVEGMTACTGCGQPKPAGRGELCESCQWGHILDRRVRINTEAFAVSSMKQAFEDFARWLLHHAGPQRAALTINRYLEFFLRIERTWGGIPRPQPLLAHFGAEGLRRFRLATRWMQERREITIDPQAKEEESDRRRIQDILGSLPSGCLARTVLDQYAEFMRARATTTRSLRLALRPAATLLLREDPQGRRLPSQKALDAYLADTPGQRAALSGFLGFLKAQHFSALVARVDAQRVVQMRRRRLEGEIAKLARGGVFDADAQRRWFQVSLEYFHHLSAREARRIQSGQAASRDSDGWRIESDGVSYWVPRPIKVLKPVSEDDLRTGE